MTHSRASFSAAKAHPIRTLPMLLAVLLAMLLTVFRAAPAPAQQANDPYEARFQRRMERFKHWEQVFGTPREQRQHFYLKKGAPKDNLSDNSLAYPSAPAAWQKEPEN